MIDATAVDAPMMTTVDYFPCSQLAQISGATNEYYRYTLVQTATDMAMGADDHGYITLIERDQGNCTFQPGAYTCTGFPSLPNGVVSGYDAVNGNVLAVCGSNYSMSTFNNNVVVWGASPHGSTSYSAIADTITCNLTATVSANGDTFTYLYSLVTVPTAQLAIVGHEGLTSIDQYDNFVGFLTPHLMGTRTTDALHNTYYNGQLLVVCEATDTDSMSRVFTQGAISARLIHWSEH